MPLNSSRALVDAPIAAKIPHALSRVEAFGVGQFPTRVVPTNTPPPPKLVNVVPAGKVTSMLLWAVLASPPVAVVAKLTRYWVRAPAPADGDALATVMFDSVLAGATV